MTRLVRTLACAFLLALPVLTAAACPALASTSGAAAPAPSDALRDIREPLASPASTSFVPYLLGGLALGLAAAGAATLVHLRRRRRTPQPWDVALERLEKARDLMQPENAYAFTSAMSEAVRDYLQKRFTMPIAHQATSELLRELAADEDGPLGPWRPFLQMFLDDCDLVKYARGELAVARMEMLHASAWRLVKETRPSTATRARAGAGAPARRPRPKTRSASRRRSRLATGGSAL